MSSLQTRLQDQDYINWVKAGLCLIHTKSGLEDFAEAASQSLHQRILTRIIPTFASAAQAVCGATVRRQNLTTTCAHPYCQSFLTEIINNGLDPSFTIRPDNLSNCNISLWHSHHWEVAKLFMNRGQLPAQVMPSQTDMSGILNFISHCKVPRLKIVNILLVDEGRSSKRNWDTKWQKDSPNKVRKARNSIMHTADMKLSAGDLQKYAQSMIDLLSDPGVACFTTAQDAVTEIQSIINAADFKISLEDETRVIGDLAAEIRTLTEGIRQEVYAVAQKGDAERQSFDEKIDEEIRKVSSLKDRLEQITDRQSQMKNTVTILTDQLKDLRAFEFKLNDIKQQHQKLAKQQEACQQTVETHDKALSYLTASQRTLEQRAEAHDKALSNLTASQESCQQTVETHDKALVNLTTSQKTSHKTVEELKTKQSETGHELLDLRTELDTSHTQTKQDIEKVKAKQEDYQRQINQRFDDLTTTSDPIPTDEDKRRLRDYLHTIYSDSEYSIVTPLPDWVGLYVRDIFTPVILVGDKKDDRKRRLGSFNELFYKEGVKQKRIMILGEAGAGKTTFCQHLVDIWCNPSSRRQFDDACVIQQYQFLFFLSCRFAESHETVFNMIENQLFDDEKSELRDIAHSVLRHNADSCLILMDGFDELQRSALAKTGKHGDITGMPSLINIQNCVLVTTSRPWKFLSVPNKEQEKFSCLELDGIKDVKQFVKTIFQEHQVEDSAKTCTDFLDAIEERDLSILMKFPITLLFAIDVWVDKGSLPKSVCLCYMNMIELAISRFARKRETANIEKSNTVVDKLLDKYSKSSKCLPKPFSYFAHLHQHAGLLLSLGHLAFDLLIQPNEQTLVFQRNVCERYELNDNDGSLKYCLGLGLLVKIESTRTGIKQKENFQFCHKTYQEFFAALWFSNRYTTEGSQEMLQIQSCIKSRTDLNNHSVLIQFLCGLCPEAGADLWKYVAQNFIIAYSYEVQDLILRTMYTNNVQDLILRTVKEARDCCVHQGEQVYYCIRTVRIGKHMTAEDVYLLCKMIQNNSCYLKDLGVVNICLSSSQYHSLLRSASSALDLCKISLYHISSPSNDSSEHLPALDLKNHCRLEVLALNKLSVSVLLLPSQEKSQLRELYLNNLLLPHDNLVKICSSLSSLTELKFTRLSCREHGDNCALPVLDLHNNHRLGELKLVKISTNVLLLPSQEKLQLRELNLNNLLLPHDNLVNICFSLSSVTELKFTRLSCREHGDNCSLPVLDLHNNHRLGELKLDMISVSGLLLPSQERSQLRELYLNNLLLPHDNLVNICSSLSSVTELKLTRLSCREHGDNCSLPVLDLHNNHRLGELKLDKISVSGLLLPSQEKSQLRELYLDNLLLPHDNLVNICSSLSSVTELKRIRLSCREHGDNCSLPVLD